MAKKKEDDKQTKQRKLALQKKFSQRITIAKQGREAMAKKDYVLATNKYREYLSILSETNDLEDIYKLSPTMFDAKKDLTEVLLISHVYWDLARISEMTPKLQESFNKSLTQFVKFTSNQPFQVLNAEMLRKYIKKNKTSSLQITSLESAYQQIFVESKKCFIATMAYGDDHNITHFFRQKKKNIQKYSLGIKFIDLYYRVSSPLTSYCEKHFRVGIVMKYLALSFLFPLYYVLKIKDKICS